MHRTCNNPPPHGAGRKREKPARRLQRRPKAGKAGPAPAGDREKYANAKPFLDALAKKGGPAPNTAICYVLTTFWAPAHRTCKITHRTCKITHRTCKITHRTKHNPPPPGAGQKREKPAQRLQCRPKAGKASPAQWATQRNTQMASPFWMHLLKKVAQHQTPLFAMF